MNRRIAVYAGLSVFLTALVFVAVRQVGGQSQATPQAVMSNFVVIDSTGKAVGPVIGVADITHTVTVALLFQGKWLPVDVWRSTFGENVLYFSSSDCTGQPFADASSSPFPVNAVAGPGRTLYVPTGPVEAITAGSGMSYGTCWQTVYEMSEAAPVSPAADLSAFTPPFTVVRKARTF